MFSNSGSTHACLAPDRSGLIPTDSKTTELISAFYVVRLSALRPNLVESGRSYVDRPILLVLQRSHRGLPG